jgi:hypothetical protein
MIVFSLNYCSCIKSGHNNNMPGKDMNILIDLKNATLNLLFFFPKAWVGNFQEKTILSYFVCRLS